MAGRWRSWKKVGARLLPAWWAACKAHDKKCRNILKAERLKVLNRPSHAPNDRQSLIYCGLSNSRDTALSNQRPTGHGRVEVQQLLFIDLTQHYVISPTHLQSGNNLCQ